MPECARSKSSPGRRMAAAGLAAALVGGAGCALQRYEPRALDADALPRAQAAVRLDDLVHRDLLQRYGRTGAWPPDAWTPAELALIAAARSTRVRVAEAEVGTREAARALAGRRPNPAVSVSVERHSRRDEEDDSKWGVGPGVSMLLSPIDRGALRAAVADSDVVTSRARVLEAAWTARHRAASGALEVVAGRRSHALLERQAERLGEAVAAAEAYAAAGLTDGFEWQMLQLEANTLRLQRLDRISAVTSAGAALAGALEVPVAALDGLEVTLPAPEIALPDYAVVQRYALSSHPKILAALAGYDRAERELELEIAAQYPDIELTPGYFFDQGDNVWSLAGSIVVPLFANHDAAIGRARAARDQARAEFEAVQAQTIANVQGAYERLSAATDAARAARRVADDVELTRAQLERQHADGLADRLTVARAAVSELAVAAHVDALEARARREVFELERAAGTALFDPAFARFLRDAYDGGAVTLGSE